MGPTLVVPIPTLFIFKYSSSIFKISLTIIVEIPETEIIDVDIET